jgi:hypothetical protein
MADAHFAARRRFALLLVNNRYIIKIEFSAFGQRIGTGRLLLPGIYRKTAPQKKPLYDKYAVERLKKECASTHKKRYFLTAYKPVLPAKAAIDFCHLLRK